jgi:hypothetical protein
MVNSNIRARSPKGNVGVSSYVDAGELSALSGGVVSGFAAASAASWTLQIGGVSGTQDVVVTKNPSGQSELLSGTAGSSIPFVIGGAPGTPGQSRTDALVVYKDPFTTSVVNDGIDVVDYQVVAGTAATTGTQVPPNEAAIRAAIPTGSLKFYAVLGYVTIAYGAGSVTTGNYFLNRSLLHTQTVANATELAFITAVEGMRVYQKDTDQYKCYDGAAWYVLASKKPQTAFMARRTTDQTLATGSGTKVQFATEDFDTGSNYDNATNYWFTAPLTGIYHFEAQINIDAAGTSVWCYLLKNAATTVAIDYRYPNTVNDDTSASVSATILLTAGDTIEVRALHNAGANRSLLGSSVGACYFSGFFVGLNS